MESSGSCSPERRGATCPSATARARPRTTVWAAGNATALGSEGWGHWGGGARAGWPGRPNRDGSCKTAHDRLGRWQRNGTWERVLAALRWKADERGLLDYSQ